VPLLLLTYISFLKPLHLTGHTHFNETGDLTQAVSFTHPGVDLQQTDLTTQGISKREGGNNELLFKKQEFTLCSL